MIIGNNYNEKKMYRGIKYYDKVPIYAEDLNELSDLLFEKNNTLLGAIIGTGLLRKAVPVISAEGVSLSKTAFINVRGDLCTVKNSEGTILVPSDALVEGTNYVYVVGWYQHLYYDTVMREYGGVKNATYENKLADNEFGVQASTRFQFRWDIIVRDTPLDTNSTVTIIGRDKDGNSTGTSTDIAIRESFDSIFLADRPTELNYVIDDIYIVPLLQVTKDAEGNYVEVSSAAVAGLHNEVAPEYALENYEYTYTADSTDTDTDWSISVEALRRGDSLRVLYEGIELTRDVHYTVDLESKTLFFNDFKRNVGDILTVCLTRLATF